MKTISWLLHHDKLFYKILYSFLLLLVPTLLVSAGLFLLSSNNMKEDFSKKVRQNLDYSVDLIDEQLNNVNNVAASTFRSYAISTYLKPADRQTLADRAASSLIVDAIAKSELICGDIVDKMFLYVDDGRVYMGNGTEPLPFFFSKHYSYKEYPTSFWPEQLRIMKETVILPPTVVEMRTFSHSVIPILFFQYVSGYPTIEVMNLSVKNILSRLENNSLVPSALYIVCNSAGQILMKSDSLDEYESKSIGQILSCPSSGEMQIRAGQLDGVVYRSDSNLMGWRYYVVTPSAEFNGSVLNVFVTMLLVCILAMLFSFFISIKLSSNLFMPISTIRDMLLNNMEPDSTQHPRIESFESLNDRIHEMLEQRGRYRRELDNYAEVYIGNILRAFLQGHNQVGSDTYAIGVIRDKCEFIYSKYTVCVLSFDSNSGADGHLENDQGSMLNSVKLLIRFVIGKQLPLYAFEMNSNMLACIVNLQDDADAGKLGNMFVEIMHQFENDSAFKYAMVGMGSIAPDLCLLHQSYIEALLLLGQQRNNSGFVVLRAEGSTGRILGESDVESIQQCLKSCDKVSLKAILTQIFSYKPIGEYVFQQPEQLVRELYYIGMKFVSERELDIRQYVLDETSPMMSFSHNSKSTDIVLSISNFYFRIMDNTVRVVSQGSLVQNVLRFIEKNFDKCSYLEAVADEFGISAKYLSHVFKEKTGTNLTEYIKWMQINKVKEYLLQTNMTIDEIAAKVGIYSRTTLVRNFKKVEGITPSEFKQSMRRTCLTDTQASNN